MTRLNKYLEREVYKVENEKRIEMNEHWKRFQDSTYFIRVLTNLMKEASDDSIKIAISEAIFAIRKIQNESMEKLFKINED